MKAEAEGLKKSEIYEDVWIPTLCRRCPSMCGILAHRVNGVVVKLEGNPNSYAGSRGGLCAKSLASLQVLYDPNRLKVPLRRTNPEKGIGVDPKWKEITWDEALNEIATKLKKVMDEDPSKIVIQGGVAAAATNLSTQLLLPILSTAKGSPIRATGGTGIHCGNGAHYNNALNSGAWITQPDWKYCNYQLHFGSGAGYGNFWQYATRQASEAISRGMKLVVFDPVCNYAAAKATEWVPIIPGTDGAVALAMLNVIVNELGIYDLLYLKHKTNAPYLVGPDGRYVRDKETKKPMVWDTAAGKAKANDAPNIGDFDLDGTHEVNGIECRPVWQVLKEHFRNHTSEKASKVSGVPAGTIRRIATEFAEAAMVGATITIGGKQLPLRPVSAVFLRGSEGHQNSTHTVFAIDLLHHVLGAANVPGGQVGVGVECHGYPGTGLPSAEITKDTDGFIMLRGKWVVPGSPWVHREPGYPRLKDLRDLFVLQEDTPIFGISDREELLKKAKVDPEIDVIINQGCNPILSCINPRDQAKFLKEVQFIVDFDLFPNEFNEGFADILLPDACYLESSDWGSINIFMHNQPPGLDPWCFHITQKVVDPQFGRRPVGQALFEILDRMGLRAKANEFLNNFLELDETHKLKPTQEVILEQLFDKVVTQHFGPEHDWEWFKKHGFISWPKKVEEVYWRPFRDVRMPLYREYMIDVGEKIKKIAQGLGIEVDWKQYTALPKWFPIHPHLVVDPQYDLYCFTFNDTLHMTSNTMEQPWLDEASSMNPYTYYITMNADMAKQKGLKAGDTIELESDKGNKVRGVLQVRKGQHPQTVTIMGCAGHWAAGQPIARGKGVHFNSLMESRWSDCDPITFGIETCVKVKVTRVKQP